MENAEFLPPKGNTEKWQMAQELLPQCDHHTGALTWASMWVLLCKASSEQLKNNTREQWRITMSQRKLMTKSHKIH